VNVAHFASNRKKVCFSVISHGSEKQKKCEATQHKMKQNESSLHKSARHHSPSQPLSQNNLLFIIKVEAKRKRKTDATPSEKEPKTWKAEIRLTTRE
jgi:hypothetical protein